MKHRLCAALIFAMMVSFLMTACNPRNLEANLDAVEDTVEQRVDGMEDAVDQRLDALEDVVEGDVRITPAPVPASSAPLVSTDGDLLTKEEAESIALTNAGLAADQVSRLYSEYDRDDGVSVYEVEFRQGKWEYDYTIHAQTGAILSWEKDD